MTTHNLYPHTSLESSKPWSRVGMKVLRSPLFFALQGLLLPVSVQGFFCRFFNLFCPPGTAGYTIATVFSTDSGWQVPSALQQTYSAAFERWQDIVTGNVGSAGSAFSGKTPTASGQFGSCTMPADVTDDLFICSGAKNLGGPNAQGLTVLAYATPFVVYAGSGLPAVGGITFNTAVIGVLTATKTIDVVVRKNTASLLCCCSPQFEALYDKRSPVTVV
jgi:hypothetical protein